MRFKSRLILFALVTIACIVCQVHLGISWVIYPYASCILFFILLDLKRFNETERNHAGKSVRGDTGGPDVASTAAKQTEGGRATERHCHRACGRGNLLRRTWPGTGEVPLGPLSRDDGGEFMLGAGIAGVGGAGFRQSGDTAGGSGGDC